MASKDFLIRLSVVFKKFGLIANEFLSAICQFLNVGIINFSLDFYISYFGNKAINGFCNSVRFMVALFKFSLASCKEPVAVSILDFAEAKVLPASL